MREGSHIVFVLGIPQSSRPWQQQCVWYRVLGPGQALQGIGCRVDYAYLEETERIRLLLSQRSVNAVVLHRGTIGPCFDALREATKLNAIPLWYDLDDNIIEPKAIEEANHLKHLDSVNIKEIQEWTKTNIACLEKCDGALLSTPALRDISLHHNKNSRLVRNYLPAFYLGTTRRFQQRQDNKIRIYYGPGSIEHKVHFDQVAEVLPAIMREFPAVEFYMGGGLESPDSLDEFRPRVITLPRMLPELYYRTLQLMDIALAPLALDAFSVAKSWVKVLEAASAGCIWVGSDHSDYRDFKLLTGTGHMANSREWEGVLVAVLENFARERSRALEAQCSIREQFSISNHTDCYLNAIGA